MGVYQKKNGKWYCRGQIEEERYHKLCEGAKTEQEARKLEDGLRFQIRQEQLGLAFPRFEKNIRHYVKSKECKFKSNSRVIRA